LERAEDWPEAARDSRLVFEHGRWHCLVPQKTAYQPADNQGRVVAIDPGIRTFATLYANGVRGVYQQNGILDGRDKADWRRENHQIRWPCG
jgi:transposase